jgi:bifunctional DNase/RNase
MRAFVQVLLIRIGAWLWALAARIGGAGRDRLEHAERAEEMFSEAAARAIAGSDDESLRDDVGGEWPVPDGYVRMNARGQIPGAMGGALLLVDLDERHFVPLFVGPTETLAMQHRLAGKRFKRPLPYDLFERLLERIGAVLVRSTIDELRDGVFIATVVVALDDGRIQELDARASDAVILALGSDCPVFVSDGVVDEAARPLQLEQAEAPG